MITCGERWQSSGEVVRTPHLGDLDVLAPRITLVRRHEQDASFDRTRRLLLSLKERLQKDKVHANEINSLHVEEKDRCSIPGPDGKAEGMTQLKVDRSTAAPFGLNELMG